MLIGWRSLTPRPVGASGASHRREALVSRGPSMWLARLGALPAGVGSMRSPGSWSGLAALGLSISEEQGGGCCRRQRPLYLRAPARRGHGQCPTHCAGGGGGGCRFRHRQGALRHGRPALAVAAGALIVATAAATIVLLAGGSSRSTPAYGAELVRFAESTPLLLLEGPDWRVENVYEAQPGPYEPRGSHGEGSMEFVTGKPIPDEAIRPTAVRVGTTPKGQTVVKAERESGMLPPPVRQRKVELSWRHGSLAAALASARRSPHPHGQRWVELPVLGTSAHVDTRAEFFTNQGGPGNRQMTAFWSEGGYLLERKPRSPTRPALRRKGSTGLTKVDSRPGSKRVPPSVVKAVNHAAAVRSMLRASRCQGLSIPRLSPAPASLAEEGQVSPPSQAPFLPGGFRAVGEARRPATGQKRAKPKGRWRLPGGRTSANWTARPQSSELIKTLVPAMPSGRYEWRKAKSAACCLTRKGSAAHARASLSYPGSRGRQREGALQALSLVPSALCRQDLNRFVGQAAILRQMRALVGLGAETRWSKHKDEVRRSRPPLARAPNSN